MRIPLALALVSLLAAPAWAQGDVSVALVNIDRILSEAQPVRAAIEAVDAEVAARQRHLETREQELLELIETYRSQSSILSEDAREQLRRDIVERRLELDEIESDLRQMLQSNEQEVITPTFERIYAEIRAIAELNEIDIVLRSDAAVYASPDLDLTDEVIEALNSAAEAGAGPNLPADLEEGE